MIGLSKGGLLAAGAYAASMIGAGFAVSLRSRDGRGPEPYREFRQAPFAPPAEAFGPAWTVNKLGTSWSVVRLAGVEPRDDGERAARRTALTAAAVNEVAFLAFPLMYFKLRSPWLAAAVTVASAAATVVQLDATRRVDRAAAGALLPQTAWLAIATPVAAYQALYTRDPLLRSAPLVSP